MRCREFVRRVRIPFFNTQMGKGAVAGGLESLHGHRRAVGARLRARAIDRADLIIAIGHDTVEKPPFIMGPDGPKVLHVGYLPATVDEVFFPHAEVVGDVGPSLTLLGRPARRQAAERRRRFLPLREGILAHIADRADESRYPLTPQRIVHDVRQVMPDDGIVCLDNGMYKIWFARNYRTHVANTLLLDNALATMGAGLPSAIMAAHALSAPPRAGGLRRRRLHDELAGARDRGAPQAQPRRADPAGRRLRHDPLEAGGRTGFPISA